MAESFGVFVAGMVRLEGGVVFCAPVPAEFEEALGLGWLMMGEGMARNGEDKRKGKGRQDKTKEREREKRKKKKERT